MPKAWYNAGYNDWIIPLGPHRSNIGMVVACIDSYTAY